MMVMGIQVMVMGVWVMVMGVWKPHFFAAWAHDLRLRASNSYRTNRHLDLLAAAALRPRSFQPCWMSSLFIVQTVIIAAW